MILGYLFVGMFAGVAGAIAMMVLGKPVWTAFLVYMGLGALVTGLGPILGLAAGRSSRSDAAADRPAAPVTAGGGAEPARRAQAAVAADHAPSVMTVLAVDDDPLILDLIPRIASQAGRVEVTAVESAEAALIALTDGARFDCILLDIEMPGTDGVALCATIRTLPQYRTTPIIMLTAKADVAFLDRAFKAGATDYVTKPFDVIELAAQLKAIEDSRGNSVAEGRAVSQAANTSGRVAAFGVGTGAPLTPSQHFIQLDALTNYLNRLPGRAVGHISVVAVKVAEVTPRLGAGSAQAIERWNGQVAAAIDEVFGRAGYVAAYAGDGEFVLLCNSDRVPDPAQCEADLNYVMARRTRAEGALPQTVGAEITVGALVSPQKSRKNRAQTAILTSLSVARARSEVGVRVAALRAGQQ